MFLEAATGWLMLGNSAEARNEIAQISKQAEETAEAALILWEIEAQERKWQNAVAAADRVITRAAHNPEGYIKRAFALHELKRSQEAWDTLHPVYDQFPENWLIPYNLACYAAQLGRESDALSWYRKALRVGEEKVLRNMALTDPDLEPIWPKIEKSALS